jgi:hypothetical protein
MNFWLRFDTLGLPLIVRTHPEGNHLIQVAVHPIRKRNRLTVITVLANSNHNTLHTLTPPSTRLAVYFVL